jgi:uncharacterized protein YndB with AHSA1/START domain
MSAAKFVYVIYISAMREQVWHALLDEEMTKQYWGRHRNRSDWKVGSAWRHEDCDDPRKVDVVGKVVESSAPDRLVLTWATPQDAGRESEHSRVTIALEPFLESVRVTVTHEGIQPGSPMLDGVSKGWPMVLSSLKTLLETGEPMPMLTRRWEGPPE